MEEEDPNEWVATVGRPKLVEAAKQSKAVWEKWKPRAGEWLACQFIKQVNCNTQQQFYSILCFIQNQILSRTSIIEKAYQLTLAEATSGTVPRAFKKMEIPATALCALRSALCALPSLSSVAVSGER